MQITVKFIMSWPKLSLLYLWRWHAIPELLKPACALEAPPAASGVMIFVWWEQCRPHTHMHTCTDIASYPVGNARFMHVMFKPHVVYVIDR